MSDKDWNTKIIKMGWDLLALRYNDIAFSLDLFLLRKWRKLMWSKVEGNEILEVGVGTGINFAYYPASVEITAIDFSEQMLKRAKKKANKQNLKVNLQLMDVQQLDFADNTFDTVVGTLVLLVVPKPVQGIIEVQRVCKPGGKVIFLELEPNAIPLLRWHLKIINPLVVGTFGVDAARGPLNTVVESDLTVEKVTSIWPGLFKLIEARKKLPRNVQQEDTKLLVYDVSFKNLDSLKAEALRRIDLLRKARSPSELPPCPAWMARYCKYAPACECG